MSDRSMPTITLSDYLAIHPDYRGVWETERDDLPNWSEVRRKYIGKRTMMAQDGSCALLIEGISFEIVRNSPTNGETKMTQQQQTAFIAVFRPHQRPAWAQAFESEQAFTDSWANGHFDSSCHANCDLEESEREHTFYNAWHDAGHDLHALTRLDSAEEVASYLADRDYHGHHNKGLGQVDRCAKELGWIVDEGDE